MSKRRLSDLAAEAYFHPKGVVQDEQDLRRLAEPVYHYWREWTDQTRAVEKSLSKLQYYDEDDKPHLKNALRKISLQHAVLSETYLRLQGLVANLNTKLGIKPPEAVPVHMPEEVKPDDAAAADELEDDEPAAAPAPATSNKQGVTPPPVTMK
mmetsp:Transcript_2144/g.5000  ORF Transcript_2144/g.5000 Transcript_2144/m.5000 type:complete len:153 (+) Transcript_2144:332-790(+)|eukprot:g146.t1